MHHLRDGTAWCQDPDWYKNEVERFARRTVGLDDVKRGMHSPACLETSLFLKLPAGCD